MMDIDIRDREFCVGVMVTNKMGMVEFGQLLKRSRDALGMTQEDLEERSGVSQNYISRLENGGGKRPGDRIIKQLATALETPEDEFKVALGWVIREVVFKDGVMLPVVGVVPADALRWMSGEGASMTEVEVLRSKIEGARSPFGLEVSGDCLRSIGILHGDVVIVEPAEGRQPRNGQLVVVRVGDEVSLKRWREDDGGTRLEDGEGNVVHTFAPNEEATVLAFYVTYEPIAPR